MSGRVHECVYRDGKHVEIVWNYKNANTSLKGASGG